MADNQRSQFTFYSSFALALRRIKKDADRAKAYDAICDYALFGKEPDLDKLPDSASIAFELIRPNLDAAAKKAKSGREGGKQNRSKQKANGKQNESNGILKARGNRKGGETVREKEGEKEKEKEKEVEVEKESECYINLPPPTRARERAAISFFLDRINPAPAGTVSQELLAFCDELGDDVVIHALQIAVNDRKTAWSYIKAILQRYKADGLTDLPAVLASETQYEEQKQRRGSKASSRSYASSSAAPRDESKTMDQLRRLREKMNGGQSDGN